MPCLAELAAPSVRAHASDVLSVGVVYAVAMCITQIAQERTTNPGIKKCETVKVLSLKLQKKIVFKTSDLYYSFVSLISIHIYNTFH